LARAPMAELVDASDSKSDSARSAGSIPARGTIRPTIIRGLRGPIAVPHTVHHGACQLYVGVRAAAGALLPPQVGTVALFDLFPDA
jgi:hypothetical protein